MSTRRTETWQPPPSRNLRSASRAPAAPEATGPVPAARSAAVAPGPARAADRGRTVDRAARPNPTPASSRAPSRAGSRAPSGAASRAVSRAPSRSRNVQVAVSVATAVASLDAGAPRRRRGRASLAQELVHMEDDEDEDDGSDDVPANAGNPPDEDEIAAMQQALTTRARFWRSPAYSFFQPPRITVYNNGIAQQFDCMKCNRSIYRMQDTLDSASTGNLIAHIKACYGVAQFDAALAAARSLNMLFSRHQFDANEMRIAVVHWIAQDLRPVNIVSDIGFLRLMKTGRPNLWLPSPTTVIRDTNDVYHQAVQHINHVLRRIDGRIHITSDAWTSPNQLAFVAFIVHYAFEGTLHHFVLDIIDVPRSHSSRTLAAVLYALLSRYNILQKFMTTTLDNASNNKTMVQALQTRLPDSFRGEQSRGNCLAHIINLGAKAITASFERQAASNGDDEDDDYELPDYALDGAQAQDEIDNADDEDFVHTLATIEEDDDDDEGDDEENLTEQAAAIADVLGKIRKLSIKVLRSTTRLRPARFKILDDLKLRHRKIPRDVATRWNSTYQLLRFALVYREALDRLTGTNRELFDLRIDDGEWGLLDGLKSLLEKFSDATEFFSRSDTGSICYAVRCIDKLIESLDDSGDLPSAALQAAAELGRRKLKKYMQVLLQKDLYLFAAVLNPALKLKFFQSRSQFSRAWIDGLMERMSATFTHDYLPTSVPPPRPQAVTKKTFAEQMFDASPVKNTSARGAALPVLADELQRYLSSPRENTRDPIAWWWEKRKDYPYLYRMAQDYCSAPATTVDVERLFSTGRALLGYLRNRLSADSVHSIMCLKSWWDAEVIRDDMFTVTQVYDDD